MDFRAYLFTVNRNNGFPLTDDELKDVEQDLKIFFFDKDYNDENTRACTIQYYRRAVGKKLNQEKRAQELAYLESGEAETDHEREQRRLESVGKLNLNKVQKKIVNFLIRGFGYDEICKKLRLNSRQLRNQVYQIKTRNIPA